MQKDETINYKKLQGQTIKQLSTDYKYACKL